MFHDPIEQRFLKADVSAGFFALDPFMFQNFFALGQELFVENGVLNELGLLDSCSDHFGIVFHIGEARSIKTHLADLDLALARTYSILPSLYRFRPAFRANAARFS